MPANTNLATWVRAALERDPRVNLHRSPIRVFAEDGTAVLEGEVASIEEKRAAVECARRVAGVSAVDDRLRVRPARGLGDGAIRDALCHHLLEEPAFRRMHIRCGVGGEPDMVTRTVPDAEGSIEASVVNGVVTLRGEVWSRAHKRLAAVLAWWTPGCRNVANELAVKPGEGDGDDEIRDAVELVLNKDPIVHAGQVTAQVRDGRVVLRGVVASQEERRLAEHDVWFIDGVRDVTNELTVYEGVPGAPMPATPPELD